VAGAIAVLKGAVPAATSAQVIQALQESGKRIADYRNPSLVKSRINLKAAVDRLLQLAGGGGGGGGSDNYAPTATVTIEGGAEATKTLTGLRVSVAAQDASAVTAMCVTSAPDVCALGTASWRAFTSQFTHDFPAGSAPGANLTVYVRLMDEWGNVMTSPATASIRYDPGASDDTDAPTATVVINGGAGLSTSNTVSVAISGQDASRITEMCLSSFEYFGCSDFIPYRTATTWTFEDVGDGPRSVFVWLRDEHGNTADAPASDSIDVDTSPPQDAFMYVEGEPYFTNQRSLWVWAWAWDAYGLGKVCIDVAAGYGSGSGCTGAWRPYDDLLNGWTLVPLGSMSVGGCGVGWGVAVGWDG
jgi:hypothetical protein